MANNHHHGRRQRLVLGMNYHKESLGSLRRRVRTRGCHDNTSIAVKQASLSD